MKQVRVSTGVIHLARFGERAPEVLKKPAESGHPFIVTQRGRAVAVLLAPHL